MFLRDLFASLRRRWYVMVAVLVVTAGAVFFAYREVPVTYDATGSVALIPPATAVISGDNPFLYMGGLEQALGVLTVKLNSPEVQRPILEKHVGASYTTARDSTTNGPIVLVAVTGSTQEGTLTALRSVIDSVPENLAALQDALQLKPEARMTSMPLSIGDKAKINAGTRTRVMLALAALGGAASLLVTGQVDKLLLRRKERGTAATGTPRLERTTDDEDPAGDTEGDGQTGTTAEAVLSENAPEPADAR
jgi:hypothetical protein